LHEVQEGTAVIPAGQCHSDPVIWDNPAVHSDRTLCFCLKISNKMGFTEMETGIPLIEDRLPAALAAEHGGYQINLYHQYR
jgi:hypothetical protein